VLLLGPVCLKGLTMCAPFLPSPSHRRLCCCCARCPGPLGRGQDDADEHARGAGDVRADVRAPEHQRAGGHDLELHGPCGFRTTGRHHARRPLRQGRPHAVRWAAVLRLLLLWSWLQLLLLFIILWSCCCCCCCGSFCGGQLLGVCLASHAFHSPVARCTRNPHDPKTMGVYDTNVGTLRCGYRKR